MNDKLILASTVIHKNTLILRTSAHLPVLMLLYTNDKKRKNVQVFEIM